MDLKRRDLFGGAAALMAAIGGASTARAASAAPQPPIGKGDPERNKRLLREAREASQMRALPSALPGADAFEPQTPLSGFVPAMMWMSNDTPLLAGLSQAQLERFRNGFPALAVSPTFLSYGPMLGDGDVIVEEWESQIYASNGTVYNNQYLSFLRFAGDQLAEFREYNDTHHAAITFGPPGGWPELTPPTAPRRRARKGVKAPASPSDLEAAFMVVDAFDLDPGLLADVTPTAGPAPLKVKPGRDGNKAVVRALRHARASGDPAKVNAFYAPGFRHYVAGERPFGWDHLPFADIYAPLAERKASPIHVRYGPLYADGDRVFEEMDIFARLNDGTVYNNWHAYVHEVRGGKVVQTREYTDTRHVWVVLGRFADWGKSPVQPRASPRRSNLQGVYMTAQIPTQGGPKLDRWQPFEEKA